MSNARIIHKRRNHTTKTLANAGSSAVFYGLSAAGYATKTSSLATVTALATGAAVSATGVGLLVGTGALYLGYTAQAGVSAYKTNKHINNLKTIYEDRNAYHCPMSGSLDHQTVMNTVLPYIIEKKRSKLHRKAAVAGTLGVYSSVETSRAVIKKAYKFCKGSLGKNREYYARVLGRHFQKCSCTLADSIVAELYSEEEMNLMVGLEPEAVIELLKDKMKST